MLIFNMLWFRMTAAAARHYSGEASGSNSGRQSERPLSGISAPSEGDSQRRLHRLQDRCVDLLSLGNDEHHMERWDLIQQGLAHLSGHYHQEGLEKLRVTLLGLVRDPGKERLGAAIAQYLFSQETRRPVWSWEGWSQVLTEVTNREPKTNESRTIAASALKGIDRWPKDSAIDDSLANAIVTAASMNAECRDAALSIVSQGFSQEMVDSCRTQVLDLAHRAARENQLDPRALEGFRRLGLLPELVESYVEWLEAQVAKASSESTQKNMREIILKRALSHSVEGVFTNTADTPQAHAVLSRLDVLRSRSDHLVGKPSVLDGWFADKLAMVCLCIRVCHEIGAIQDWGDLAKFSRGTQDRDPYTNLKGSFGETVLRALENHAKSGMATAALVVLERLHRDLIKHAVLQPSDESSVVVSQRLARLCGAMSKVGRSDVPAAVVADLPHGDLFTAVAEIARMSDRETNPYVALVVREVSTRADELIEALGGSSPRSLRSFLERHTSSQKASRPWWDLIGKAGDLYGVWVARKGPIREVQERVQALCQRAGSESVLDVIAGILGADC